ncbi:helix-turn-helix domain-containing protein [Acidithiobacillus acidisediminis]|uniref:helix-turn-helix domain-containing protein n=1 Tax=Acidithiobacillus acidisediminis TaxID=2937799 RepID=UPI003D67C0C7
MQQSISNLLTTRDAAAYLRLSESWLNKDRVLTGRIPFVRIGRAVRYRQHDLEQFIAQCQHLSTSDRRGVTQ